MKKLFALLLAAVMCFSLVACGGGETPSTNDDGGNNATHETENSTTDNTDYASELTQLLCEKNVWYGMCHGKGSEEEFTFFEYGHFEVNSNSHTWEFKEYHKDATDYLASYAFQTTPNYDAARGLYVTDRFLLGYDTDGNLLLYWNDYFCYNESQYELVEITLENWQDYFEMREYHEFKENAFGEFDRANTKYTLVIKDGIDIEASESNVVIEYIRTVDYKPYKVDFENKTITHGETIRTETNTDNPTIVEMKTQLYDKYGATLFQSNYNRLEGNSERVFVDFELLRIKGSIYILH